MLIDLLLLCSLLCLFSLRVRDFKLPSFFHFEIRTGTLEVPQRSSPATSHTTKQQKASVADTELVPSPATRTPRARSPKIVNRRSPCSPASEVSYYSSSINSSSYKYIKYIAT